MSGGGGRLRGAAVSCGREHPAPCQLSQIKNTPAAPGLVPGRADLAGTGHAGCADAGRDVGRCCHAEKGMGHALGDPSVSQLCPSSPAQLRVLRGLFLLFSTTVGTKTGSSTLRSLCRGLDGQWAVSREPWGATGEEAPQFGDMVPPTHTPQALAACRMQPRASFPCTALSQPSAA